MKRQPVSIFNDVIGPVMRGPSSSHVAASARIGRLAVQLIRGKLKRVVVEFDTKGAIAPTYHGHGTDIGLVGGLLGWDPDDGRIPDALAEARSQGIDVCFNIVDFPADHPNTMRIALISDEDEEIHVTAVSLGGGAIEIREVEGFDVSIRGDFYETLLFPKNTGEAQVDTCISALEEYIASHEYICSAAGKNGAMINIKTRTRLAPSTIEDIRRSGFVSDIKTLEPVLPIMSRRDCNVPFNTAAGMLDTCRARKMELWELAALYESARSGLDNAAVLEKMGSIVVTMLSSIRQGLERTSYEDRILGPQAWRVEASEKEGKLVPAGVMNTVIAWTMAMMEVKSSMGVIVAAPTAGSCGVLPGAVLGTASQMGLGNDEAAKAMLAAGLIGVFICEHATFAAEVCGCQAECGAGSAMAAAGVVQLAGGTAEQGVNAASMAIQSVLGLICDPVADRVEVPCLGRNVMAAANAIASANMALAGVDPVVPLDEAIESMYRVGLMLPPELRCTGLGGLSLTETSRKLLERLKSRSV